jgi:hypothetical protein
MCAHAYKVDLLLTAHDANLVEKYRMFLKCSGIHDTLLRATTGANATNILNISNLVVVEEEDWFCRLQSAGLKDVAVCQPVGQGPPHRPATVQSTRNEAIQTSPLTNIHTIRGVFLLATTDSTKPRLLPFPRFPALWLKRAQCRQIHRSAKFSRSTGSFSRLCPSFP